MEPASRRRPVAPLALVALLILGVCAALVAVVIDGPDASPSRSASDGVASAAPTGDTPARERATPPVPSAIAGGGSPPHALEPRPEDPDYVARRTVEAEAQRRVFDDADQPRSQFPGSRRGGTRVGVGGSASGGFAGRNSPLEGRVVDARTGEPLADAEVVSLLSSADGWARRWAGVRAAEDGTFRVRTTARRDEQPAVLVRAPGYRTLRTARGDAPDEWRLEPFDGPDRGTIRGRAETPDGAPLAGMLLVGMKSEHGDAGDQYAWSDGSGTFELRGVRPGRWRLWLEREREAETTVAAGGLATARLVAARADAPPPERPGSDRRAVEVTGLSEGSTLRADAGPGVFWRAMVRDGVARFELPFGLWILTVDERDGALMPITVRAGAGPKLVEFVPDR